ncbi:hypothetical protein [Ferroglobus placidus]|nr:hypothetical protein [Ferroglobus placidus]
MGVTRREFLRGIGALSALAFSPTSRRSQKLSRAPSLSTREK